MQQYLPEFHMAIIMMSAAFMAVAGIVMGILGTRETAPSERRDRSIVLYLLGLSILLGGLAMSYAFGWFLNPVVNISYQAVFILLFQAIFTFVPFMVYMFTSIRRR